MIKGDENGEQKKAYRIVFGRTHVSGCNNSFPGM
jgi:hypothetical protein